MVLAKVLSQKYKEQLNFKEPLEYNRLEKLVIYRGSSCLENSGNQYYTPFLTIANRIFNATYNSIHIYKFLFFVKQSLVYLFDM